MNAPARTARAERADRLAPDQVERGRLAEDEAARRGRTLRIEAKAWKAIEQAADRGVRLQAREVHADAHVRSRREGDLVAHVLAADVEAIRVGKEIRVAVGAGDRNRDELARADRGVTEPDVCGGVSVYRRRRQLEP